MSVLKLIFETTLASVLNWIYFETPGSMSKKLSCQVPFFSENKNTFFCKVSDFNFIKKPSLFSTVSIVNGSFIKFKSLGLAK